MTIRVKAGAFAPPSASSFLVVPDVSQPAKQEPTEPAASEPAKPEVPEKYRGKSVDDVIDMHRNAERRLGELQNEVGSLRGLIRDLSVLQQPVATPESPEQETLEITGDDLLRDPAGTVRKVVQHDSAKAEYKRNLDSQEAELSKAQASFMADFADAKEITASEEFQAFAARTPSRQADMQIAAFGTGMEQVRAARRLLEDYKDFQASTAKPAAPSAEEKALAAAKAASTEAGNANGGTRIEKEILTQSEMVDLINKDPAKWRSPSTQAALIQAIKEGRYRG